MLNKSEGGGYVYADYNATAPINKSVKQSILEVLSLQMLNPSSLHRSGQKARKILENARDDVYNFIGVSNNKEIVFTSSATEANNLVMFGMQGYQHVISAIEHPSILNSAHNPQVIPVNRDGIVDLVELEKILNELKGNKVLVSVMMANNETGVIQPIKRIAEIVHKFGGVLHTDAAQSVGKIDVNMENLGVDLLTLSAHKFGGIAGSGVLIFDKKLEIKPMIFGGGQEKGLRGGTENIIAIAGLSAALRNIPELLIKMKEIEILRDQLEYELAHRPLAKPIYGEKFSGEVKTSNAEYANVFAEHRPASTVKLPSEIEFCKQFNVFGRNAERLPNTSCVYMPGVKNDVQLMNFDLNNIAVSNGSACSSGKIEPSYVLLAMGATKEQAECSIRISIGWETKSEDIKKIVNCWLSIYNKSLV